MTAAHAVTVADRKGREVRFEAEKGERILLAGLAAGLPLPHECASGTCGACRARVVEGQCESLWPEAPGARNLRDPADILMCQSAALGPLRLALRAVLPAGAEGAPFAARGEVRRITRPSAEVETYAVTLDRPMPYRPGQFVLLELDGIAGPRAYSMIRRAADPMRLDLLVRRGPGAGTAALFALGEAAAPARVFGPLGRAVFRPEEDRPFAAIAGGSGIAGMLAILEEAAATGHHARRAADLFFGLRDPGSAYLLEELDAAARAAGGGPRVTVALSDAPADEALRARYPGLRFAEGYVHEVAAADLSARPDPARLHFVAGPPPMVDAAMRALVTDLRVAPEDIRYDRFG